MSEDIPVVTVIGKFGNRGVRIKASGTETLLWRLAKSIHLSPSKSKLFAEGKELTCRDRYMLNYLENEGRMKIIERPATSLSPQ